jgi:hypothetical protein
MGNDFRDQLRVIGKSINNPAKIAKGSFGPTFAEEPSSPNNDKADDPQDEDEIEAKANNKNKKDSGTKRKRGSLMQHSVGNHGI